MIPELRPYQQDAMDRVRHALTLHRRVLLSAPVGAGKTIVACAMIRAALAKGRRVLFLVHRRELLQQAHDRLAAFGIDAGIIIRSTHRLRPATVASVQTLVRRELPPADLIFVDEAHRSVAPTFKQVLSVYQKAWIVGLSATPYRLDGKGLSEQFDSLVTSVTTADLIRDGYLVQPIVYSPGCPDVSRIPKRHGDFATGPLAEAASPLTGDVLKHWLRLAENRPTVAFCVNLAHAAHVAETFRNVGIPATSIAGSDADREHKLAQLRTGHTKVLASVDLLGEGWDFPELSCAILARPTASLSVHHQQIGRVLRTFPGKNGALILDHAGNHDRLGAIDDPITLNLEGVTRQAVPRILTCPKCFAAYRLAPCPQCGHEPEPSPIAEETLPRSTDDELQRYTKQDREGFYRTLVLQAFRKRQSLGTARHAYRARFKVWPRHSEIERLYVCTEHEPQDLTFGPRRVTRCRLCLQALPRASTR